MKALYIRVATATSSLMSVIAAAFREAGDVICPKLSSVIGHA